MKPLDAGLYETSTAHFSTPSSLAKELFFYPLSAGHSFCKEGYHTKRKKQSAVALFHIVSGTLTFSVDETKCTAEAGETVLLNCYEGEEYGARKPAEFFWLHFSGGSSYEFCKELIRRQGNVLRLRDADALLDAMAAMERSMAESKVDEPMLSGEIHRMMCRCFYPAPQDKEGGYTADVERIKAYIRAHYIEKIKVKDLARRANMSDAYFSRVFKKETGFSPYEYLLLCRLDAAKDLLQKTDMTISAVAYQVGFNSSSNFIFTFTTKVGKSPNQFRKLKF